MKTKTRQAQFETSVGSAMRFGSVYFYDFHGDGSLMLTARPKKSDSDDSQVRGSIHFGNLTQVRAFGGGRSIRNPIDGRWMKASSAKIENFALDPSRLVPDLAAVAVHNGTF